MSLIWASCPPRSFPKEYLTKSRLDFAILRSDVCGTRHFKIDILNSAIYEGIWLDRPWGLLIPRRSDIVNVNKGAKIIPMWAEVSSSHLTTEWKDSHHLLLICIRWRTSSLNGNPPKRYGGRYIWLDPEINLEWKVQWLTSALHWAMLERFNEDER